MSKEAHANVVATFGDPAAAESASRALQAEGFDQTAILVTEIKPQPLSAGEQIENGACMGSMAGAGIGALMGAGFLTAGIVPGVVAASGLSTILATSVSGALAGFAFGAAAGEPEILPPADDVAGRTVMTVLADDRSAEAADILRQNGADDAQAVAR